MRSHHAARNVDLDLDHDTFAMPLSSKLDRKLRAAEESSDDEEYYEVTDRSSSPSLIETGDGGELLDSEDGEGDEHGSEDEAMVCILPRG